jgi:hypothetical protein
VTIEGNQYRLSTTVSRAGEMYDLVNNGPMANMQTIESTDCHHAALTRPGTIRKIVDDEHGIQR